MVNVDFAETLLIDLLRENLLQVVIRVNCINDDYEHSIFFNSFEDFYTAPSNMLCGQCGAPLDWKNAKVGFKRGIYK
jgi:hypothetical protein